MTQDQRSFKKKDLKLKLAESIYICQCGKNFLSFPAIYSHAKSKHNVKLTSKASSGAFKRTKDNNQEKIYFKLTQNEDNQVSKLNQDEKQFETKNIVNCGTSFKFISKISKIYNSTGELNIYGVTSKYLQQYSNSPNQYSLSSIADTFLLYTQCINSHYMLYDQTKIHKNYCQDCVPQIIPAFLNFFIIWYLPSNSQKHHQLNKKLDLNQICGILQIFCKWLKKKNYTNFDCNLNEKFVELEKQSASSSTNKISSIQQ